MEEICFWSPDEVPYGGLSNLFPRPIVIDGKSYRSAEHAIKSAQARDAEVKFWLESAPTPSLAAAGGGSLSVSEQVERWEDVRLHQMRRILMAKFSQHADLRATLFTTGDANIVELAPYDDEINRFWSRIEGSDKGANWLGVMLVELRADLKRAEVLET